MELAEGTILHQNGEQFEATASNQHVLQPLVVKKTW